MAILCFVTDRRLYGGDERRARVALLDAIQAAARAGIDLIQIRERDLDDRTLLSLARDAVASAAGTATRVLVNDRADVAIASGAQGVHLRADSAPASRVRRIQPALTIGRSVHGSEETSTAAADGGCDYLLAGTVFQTPSKPESHPLLGLEGLRRVCAAVGLPVVAIGGMSADRASDVARTGAAGIGGIRMFADPFTVAETAARVRRSFDT